ncbi:acyl carrier protein [Halothiobacillus neapolitanus]|uniref:Phosphopantetheine-binding protein n=1 Tax=Halothiobacillus neapolitanus (strain ATCC 23641 / DSM 15147 / CIP 104769 / NCIMB 8539 / c2) TaxID=555778 RepID=D0KZC2_HALNC|nr:acyl carrier protein [Halothiobacillus neapolitanus]ACX95795.1 phosphopantetheine-binding protein [Halothiobacillus neapolitanus c2]TDN66105.1 phosphopantetheine binding protein [Halothiobacillus neapolitanus]
MNNLSVIHKQIEDDLISIARLVLHCDVLKTKQSLFEQGLTSVGALEIRDRIEKKLDISLMTSVIFDYPTIDSLSAYVTKVIRSGGARVVPELQPETTTISSNGHYELSDEMVREILKRGFGV